jgi:hypothetical protein
MRSALRVTAAVFLLVSVALGEQADRPDCACCGTEITGEYAHYDELGWSICSVCNAAERCAGCGLPLAGGLRGDDGWCARCVASADRCTACGRPMLETYWTIEGVEGRFCPSCRTEAPECASCGAPTRDGRRVGERIFCRDCRAAWVGPGDYDGIYREVISRFRSELGLEIARIPELVIEQDGEALAVQGPDAAAGADVCGLYLRDESGRTSIHLLSHLSVVRTTAVLAHELAHAWQAENCPPDQGPRLREGFAEWVAWKLLEGVPGGEGERTVIAGRSDEYGEGYRVFAEIERTRGVSGPVWYARSARRS